LLNGNQTFKLHIILCKSLIMDSWDMGLEGSKKMLKWVINRTKGFLKIYDLLKVPQYALTPQNNGRCAPGLLCQGK